MVKKLKIFGQHLIDPKAIDQFYEAIKHPRVRQAALMPDGHFGYSLPIGGVAASYQVVKPGWVGYDIGCGVCAVQTTFSYEDFTMFNRANEAYDAITRFIPVGFKHRTSSNIVPYPEWEGEDPTPWLEKQFDERGYQQLGTLGGGNHFIEVCFDPYFDIWFVLHSGSRGIGHNTADHYMKKAERLCPESGWLHEGTGPFEQYMKDYGCMIHFALDNRKVMLELMEEALQCANFDGHILWDSLINKVHNSVTRELLADGVTYGYVHRKGATSAKLDEPGVIPGNMSTGSIIVKGKGNPDSLCSASHGAGRVSSRTVARKACDMITFTKQMKDVVTGDLRSVRDENPNAYKNPTAVMNEQRDLVEEVTRLWPILNIKG